MYAQYVVEGTGLFHNSSYEILTFYYYVIKSLFY